MVLAAALNLFPAKIFSPYHRGPRAGTKINGRGRKGSMTKTYPENVRHLCARRAHFTTQPVSKSNLTAINKRNHNIYVSKKSNSVDECSWGRASCPSATALVLAVCTIHAYMLKHVANRLPRAAGTPRYRPLSLPVA